MVYNIDNCVDCICLPICKNKNAYGLFLDCKPMITSVESLRPKLTCDKKDYLILNGVNKEFEIYLTDKDKIQLEGVDKNISIDTWPK